MSKNGGVMYEASPNGMSIEGWTLEEIQSRLVNPDFLLSLCGVMVLLWFVSTLSKTSESIKEGPPTVLTSEN